MVGTLGGISPAASAGNPEVEAAGRHRGERRAAAAIRARLGILLLFRIGCAMMAVMVTISVQYEGGLHCAAVHGPSGAVLPTDAPRDNQGLGEAFSPTDLVATALGSCVITTMAIVAKRKGYDLPAITAEVEKHMTTEAPRRIAKIVTRLTLPLPSDHPDRAVLEAAAHACPVHHSLHPDVEKDIRFSWTGAAA